MNSGPAGGLPEQPGPEEKPARPTTTRDRPTMGVPETRSASLGGPQSDDVSRLRENAERTRENLAADTRTNASDTRKPIAADPANPNRMKLGAAAVAVLVAFLWARRRRASRRPTRWDRTLLAAREASARASDLGTAVLTSDQAARARSRARQAGSALDAAPRAQGAAATIAALAALRILRRVVRGTPPS